MEMATAAASPRVSWRSRSNGAPFARCSLGSVRLLVGFTLLAEEAVAARSFLLRTAGLDCTLPCAVLLPMTAAVRNVPAFGGRFDASLAMVLGSCVGAFDHRSVSSLAEYWSERAESLRGLELAALVWWLARDPRFCVRPLERKVVRSIDSGRLLPHPWAQGLAEPRRR